MATRQMVRWFAFALASCVFVHSIHGAQERSTVRRIQAAPRFHPTGDIPYFVTYGYRGLRTLAAPQGTPLHIAAADDPPAAMAMALTVGANCVRNIDCDDCDPCTTDVCARGECAGGTNDGEGCQADGQCAGGICILFGGPTVRKCVNNAVPDGGIGECSDGHLCNGIETCQGGVCAAGSPGDVCPAGAVCNPNLRTPSEIGRCAPECFSDAGCGDGAQCNGTEWCDLTTNLCEPDLRCRGGFNDDGPCTNHDDCPGGGACTANVCGPGAVCIEPTDPVCSDTEPCCGFGRCCDQDDPGACTRELLADCDLNNNRWLGTGDCPGTLADEGSCTAIAEEAHCSPGLDASCGRYSAGIAPPGTWTANTPGFRPMQCWEDVTCPAGLPPHLDCTGLYEVGDDYELEMSSAYFRVTTLRFVGGERNNDLNRNGRVRISFYTEDGTFIEDTITGSLAFTERAVWTIILQEGIVIPKKGYWAVSVAQEYAEKGNMVLAYTDDVDHGNNEPGTMWANGAPIATSSIASAGVSGILAFELVGDELGYPPLGGCCNADTGACTTLLPWECRDQGGIFRGVGAPCGICTGNLFTSCDGNEDCERCQGGTNNGMPCDANADCGTFWLCDQLVLECDGGPNDGDPCDPNVECPGGGSCPGGVCLPFNPTCAYTACCNSATGECQEVGPYCSDDPNKRCVLDIECGTGVCVLEAGRCDIETSQVCLTDQECIENGWGNNCIAQCDTGSGFVGQGFGTSCDPNCCPQPEETGEDDCQNVIPTVIPVPGVGDPPVTFTTSGDNSPASFPDSCTAISAFAPDSLGVSDPGWWEGFAIDKCADVRIDFCCSDLIKEPVWTFLVSGCPCARGVIPAAPVEHPIGTGESSGAHGAPFCAEDNQWLTFGPLPPDFYYYPVFSDPNGALGPYQMHVTVGACPVAACCLDEARCVNTVTQAVGIPCPNGNECDFDETCEVCAQLNELDCEYEAGGYWLGPGVNILPDVDPVFSCTVDIGGGEGPCDRGSCCLSPGECEDRLIPPIPCDYLEDPTGTCIDREICSIIDGIKFVGGAQCDYPTPPCPLCEFDRPENCTDALESAGFWTPGDRDSDAGWALADDFMPATIGDITRMCIQGVYTDRDRGVADCGLGVTDDFEVCLYETDPVTGMPDEASESCTTTAVQSKARVAGSDVYVLQLELDAPFFVNADECYWISASNNTVGGVPAGNECTFHWLNRFNVGLPRDGNELSAWNYGERGWLPSSVDLGWCIDIPYEAGGCGDVVGGCCSCASAATAAADPLCGADANMHDCRSTGGNVWHPEATCDALATCEDNLAGWPYGDHCRAASFDGATKACTPANSGKCVGGLNDGSACTSAADCPPGVSGESAGCLCDDGPMLITGDSWLQRTDNSCADTDGDVVLPSEQSPSGEGFANDLWYVYTAAATGFLKINTCGGLPGHGSGGYDGFLAVYHDDDNPTTCACPGSSEANLWPLGRGSDDDCYGYPSGSGGLIESPQQVHPGDCFVIRIGGVSGGAQTQVQRDDERSALSIEGFNGGQGQRYLDIGIEEPPDCQPSSPPIPEGIPYTPKNRFISFSAGDAGRMQALRITLVRMPPPFEVFNGQTMWLQEPQFLCERANVVSGDDPSCFPSGTYWAGLLGCEPYFRDWTVFDVVHAFGREIVPRAEYRVEVVDAFCDLDNPSSYSAPLPVKTTDKWGDVIPPFAGDPGLLEQPEWADVEAVLAKFQGLPTAPAEAQADLGPAVPDGLVNIFGDVTGAVDGYIGECYPYLTSTDGPQGCPGDCCLPNNTCTQLPVWDCEAVGGMTVANCTEPCDRCRPSSQPVVDMILGNSGSLVASKKNRFLSIQLGETGRQKAIRVTFLDLPGDYADWNETQMWVQEPAYTCEIGALISPEEPACEEYPVSLIATLGCNPVYRDWTPCTVHVYHEGIVPGRFDPDPPPDGTVTPALYRVDVIGKYCDPENSGDFSPPLSLSTARWGDLVGNFDKDCCDADPEDDNDCWRAADGSVDVTDFLATVDKFSSARCPPRKARADVEPANVDLILNVTNDTLYVLDAFRGLPYPFDPSSAVPPCP